MSEPTDTDPAADEPPPFWGSWRTVYLAVAGLLVLDTLVFWLVTKWAS